MGMALENREGESFQCNGSAWSMILILARQYGWKPSGTLPPIDEDTGETDNVHLIEMHQPQRLLSWMSYYLKKVTGRKQDYWDRSNYETNDGQRVTDADARNLAEVLSVVRNKIVGTELQKEYYPDPDAYFTPFIVYFRKGGFSIY